MHSFLNTPYITNNKANIYFYVVACISRCSAYNITLGHLYCFQAAIMNGVDDKNAENELLWISVRYMNPTVFFIFHH